MNLPEDTEKPALSGERGTESGTVGGDSSLIDPGLAHVANAWPTLPEAVRRAVLAPVQEAGQHENGLAGQ